MAKPKPKPKPKPNPKPNANPSPSPNPNQVPHWGYLVLDEAHRLKNKDGKALAALHALGVKHKLALTGTPLQNNVGELWSVLNLLDPASFGDSDAFEESYGDMHSAEQVGRLTALLRPYLLRRTKGDVDLVS